MMAKAPKQSGASGASAPPASITSASPRTMARNASPIAIAPEAQLIPLVELGPVQPELDRDVAARGAGEHGERERRVDRPRALRSGTRW